MEKKQSEPFCHACLSVGRTLYPLEKYSDIYSRICCNFCKQKKTNLSIKICWECVAILRKAKIFEENVIKSQNILALQGHKQSNIKKSLSHLQVIHLDPDNIINIKHEEDNKCLIQNIKEELDPVTECDYNECTDNYDNYSLLEELKTEFKSENCDITIKRKRNKKPKQYKYVFDKISRNDLEKLSKEIPIEMKEIKYWMGKERDSVVYKNATYKCEMCVQFWKTEKGLAVHSGKYHGTSSGPYICDICRCRFHNKKRLTVHLSRHMCVLECATCRHRCYVPRHMAAHLAEHTRRVQCTACGITGFSNMRQLYRHYRELHESFVCDLCSKRCRSKHMLEKHMRHHFESYECKICDRRYRTRATLRKHCDTRHCAATREHAYCAPCDKQFGSAPLYRRHVAGSRAHAAERTQHRTATKVPCPSCGRVYSRKTYMMNHYRHVHMNQSNYYCQLCDRHFLNRTRYVDHVRYKHEGVQKEKNKMCNICGRGFAANRTLINHIRTHSGERPFECAHCGGKFTQKHAMLSHVRHVHLNGKRRACWPVAD